MTNEVDSPLDPRLQGIVRAIAFGIDQDETRERPASKFHRPHVRLGERPLQIVWANANHEGASSDAATYLAADHEGTPTDHRLLDNVLSVRQDRSYARRNGFVVRHGLGDVA